MLLGDLSFFEAINARMHWLNQRQRVLAENVANSNTPEFRAKDLVEPNFHELLQNSTSRVTLRATSGKSFLGSGHQADMRFKVQETDDVPDKSGNSVELEREMMKVSQTAADHELMSNLYKKGMDLMRVALSRPSRG